jgi:beta-galactosidase
MRTHRSGCRWLLALSVVLASAQLALAQQTQRLTAGWEYLRQDLGGPWEAVRPVVAGNPESVPLWEAVTLPHCFNARDAVDPALNYYQGPGWYRTQLAVQNPYPGGRTRLHFEGAGQKTEVYIGTTKVGSHVGGYDEWTVDITQAVADFQKTEAFQKQFKGKIPLAIRCDNSRDLEMIPSDLSDFNVYGGLYRYLNLEYRPAVALERVAAKAEVDATGKTGTLTLHAAWPETGPPSAATNVAVRLLDPQSRDLLQRHVGWPAGRASPDPAKSEKRAAVVARAAAALHGAAHGGHRAAGLSAHRKGGLSAHRVCGARAV